MAGRKGRSGGHNRLSPQAHLLRGTFNVTRHGRWPVAGLPPVVSSQLDTPPAWLDPAAQAEWRRLVGVLGQSGTLAETDADALAVYCEAYVTWKQATAKVRQFGLVIKGTDDQPRPSPYVKIAHQAVQHMRAFLVEFGMTPSSRARVPGQFVEAAPVSKWGQHL